MMMAGAVLVAGVLACRRHRCRHHAHCGGEQCGMHEHEHEHEHGDNDSCGCHKHHHGGRWGGRFGRRFWLRPLLLKLDATPGQEKELGAAFDEFEKRAREAKALFESSRQAAARAMESEVFDDVAMGEAQVKAHEASTQIKDAFEVTLRRIHSVLDNEQRRRLAKLVARGSRGWWR